MSETNSPQGGTDGRTFSDALGHVWFALTGINPATLVPQVVGTVAHAGGTRPAWRWQKKGMEYVVLAWPEDQPIRAAVLMAGPENGELRPISTFPLIEGLPNDLTVETSRQRPEGLGGEVAVEMQEGKNPMWFFDPLYGRDESDLTPGVTHTFWLAAIALSIRKALLDNVTLTQGPQFEAWARQWLEENPGRATHEVPPLQIDIKDRHFIMPGRFYGEYQLRGKVGDIQEYQLEKMPVRLLYFNFPFENRPDLRLPVYVSDHVRGDMELEEGQEIEIYAWFQGRIIDLENPGMGAVNGAKG